MKSAPTGATRVVEPRRPPEPLRAAEHRLAVQTLWFFFGLFAAAFVLSGFREDSIVLALVGYGFVVAAFVAHLIANSVYGRDFRPGEVAFALGIYGLLTLLFLLAPLFGVPHGRAGLGIGFAGFALGAAGFLAYLVTRFGLKGAFSAFHPAKRS